MITNPRKAALAIFMSGLTFLFSPALACSQGASTPEKIIIDTDIGDDVDDAFALALAVQSPELEILGVTTTFGDTEARAKITDRFLAEVGRAQIPVLAGKATATKNPMSQKPYGAGRFIKPSHADAVDFLLGQIRKHPDEITLIAIGPLMNVGAAIDKDAAAFRKFKRVVLMGGSIRRGYGDLGYTRDRGPQPEYNIYSDVAAAQKLFTSGVPIFMMPLDSTQLLLDENKRTLLFATGSPMTNSLAALYFQWVKQTRTPTATLFDAMAVAYAVHPELCPVEPFHIIVDDKGMTRPTQGTPNASACLNSDSEQFFHFLLPRLMGLAGGTIHSPGH